MNAPHCCVICTMPVLFCTQESLPGTALYINTAILIFTDGSTNDKVESLCTKQKVQRSSRRIRSYFYPGSSGTNRPPAEFTTLYVYNTTIFCLQYQNILLFFFKRTLLAEGSTLDTCNVIRRPELDDRNRHRYLLRTVSRGHPSLSNG
jgi:hypothetical protein